MIELDKKDRKILYQLDVNSRQSDSQIAKKVRLNKNTVRYRINRLVKANLIRNFVTLINPAKFGKSIFKIYLRLQDTTNETWNKIKNYLLSQEKVFWVSRYEGNWDIIVAVWSKSPYEFYKFYIEFTTKFAKVISNKQMTNQIEVPFFTRGYLSKTEGKIKCVWGGQIKEEKIDALDTKLLEALATNARMPATEIATKLKTTPRSIIYRIKDLIKKEIILAFSIQLNQSVIDYDYYKVIFHLKNSSQEDEFIDFCKKQGNILYYIKTLGPWELELELEVKNHKELNKIMNSIRERFSDMIKSYEPLLITEEYKGEYNTMN
jgi:Lrp/AsnC family transcriptional regulator, leucine-responsive regulatory protein